MTRSEQVLLVGSAERDCLLRSFAAALAERGHQPIVAEPDSFARRTMTVGSGVWLDDRQIAAILNRWPGHSPLSTGFVPEDVDFAHAEARAVLLDAMTHPTVLAVNAADATSWYAAAEWPIWRRRCLAAGVAVTPLTVGEPAPDAVGPRPAGRWLTWSGVITSCPPDRVRSALAAAVTSAPGIDSVLWCCGSTVPVRAGVAAGVSRLLDAYGVRLASVLVGPHGEVLAVDNMPVVPPDTADTIATILAEWLDNALAAR